MVDRYTKIVLTVIALALAALAARPLYEAKPAGAQSPISVKIIGSDSYSLTYAGPLHVICDSGCR